MIELPNYMNGQLPGLLLDPNPTGTCGFKGADCGLQDLTHTSDGFGKPRLTFNALSVSQDPK